MAEPIQFQSALPELIKQLMGEQQTTSGGTTTTSGTSSVNTDPLQQVFAQQMNSSTPEGMAAMLQELFAAGAQKVPELTQAYANATGSRTTGNSGLALALAELNRKIAGQAAVLATDQQAKAAQTAGTIAQATKGANTTQTQTTPTVTKSAGMGTGSSSSLGLGLAGLGINAADKLGLLKALKSKVGLTDTAVAGTSPLIGPAASSAGVWDTGGPTASVVGDPASFESSMGIPSFSTDPLEFGGLGVPTTGFSMDTAFAPDIGMADFADVGMQDAISGWGNWDTANAGDAAALAEFTPSDVADYGNAVDFTDYVPDTTDVFDSFSGVDFGSFFADGGMVRNRMPGWAMPRRMKSDEPDRMADGGQVRNRAYMGAKSSSAPTSRALNYQPAQPAQQLIQQLAQQTGSTPRVTTGQQTAAMQPGAGTPQKNKSKVVKAAYSPSTEGSGFVAGPNQTSASFASPSSASFANSAMISALSMANPVVALALSLLTSTPSLQAKAINSIVKTINPPTPPAIVPPAIDNTTDAGVDSGEDTGPEGTVTVGPIGPDTGPVSPDDSAAGGGDAGGVSSGQSSAGGISGEGGGTGPGVGDGSGGDGGSAGDGSGGDGSGGGDGGGWANGGKIVGKGTGISDSVPIKASPGEFVLSKDVVDFLGADFLQAIQDKIHTPAVVQRIAGIK